jgi:TRAP-type mannitol/chloroaromatic compound transport system permease large subunit
MEEIMKKILILGGGGMTKHEISYISKTAIPMVLLMILMVIILVIWPELATWLPDNMRQGPG